MAAAKMDIEIKVRLPIQEIFLRNYCRNGIKNSLLFIVDINIKYDHQY